MRSSWPDLEEEPRSSSALSRSLFEGGLVGSFDRPDGPLPARATWHMAILPSMPPGHSFGMPRGRLFAMPRITLFDLSKSSFSFSWVKANYSGRTSLREKMEEEQSRAGQGRTEQSRADPAETNPSLQTLSQESYIL